jgi:FkbM family methyltransferase
VPSAFARLEARRAGDPLWDSAPLALGRAPGSLTINVAGNDAASSSLLPMSARHLRAAPGSATIERREIPVDTLERFYARLPEKGAVRLLKLDTQGYEGEILAGAGAALAAFRLIHIELSTAPLYAGQPLMHEVLAPLYRAGFELVDLQPYMYEPSTGCLLQLNGTLRRAG